MDNIVMTLMKGMLQSKLQQLWIPTDWVNFNDMNSINQFAQSILPGLLKNNPQAKEMIKNNIGTLDDATKEEVVKIIDSI